MNYYNGFEIGVVLIQFGPEPHLDWLLGCCYGLDLNVIKSFKDLSTAGKILIIQNFSTERHFKLSKCSISHVIFSIFFKLTILSWLNNVL